MASTVSADVTEYRDPPEEVEAKIDQIANLIKNAKYIVGFTGAGISTSAGIPDFRGPQGFWTRRAQNLPAPKRSTPNPLPTPTHMVLQHMLTIGVMKHLISQNTDGLHLRSGVPKDRISELHGNTNVERCSNAKCGEEFWRRGRVRVAKGVHDHKTGRTCPRCSSPLHDTIINFNESLARHALQNGFQYSQNADLIICLGSSLRVSPACDMPLLVHQRKGRVVIVNLQGTPLDGIASVRVGARIDDVMTGVARRLGWGKQWESRDVSAGLEKETQTRERQLAG
ncbi:hypothetical protein HDV00_008357 [Rhizophlyctis rosea]|nr:hypothetical protein HDV00_008357 [Rhizophlyctis rosea]